MAELAPEQIVRLEDDAVVVLDQRRLPDEEIELRCRSAAEISPSMVISLEISPMSPLLLSQSAQSSAWMRLCVSRTVKRSAAILPCQSGCP